MKRTNKAPGARRDCPQCNASVPGHAYEGHVKWCADYQQREAEERSRGAIIAKVLQLKRSREYPDRYETTQGTKTDLGLFRTVQAIIEGKA